MLPTHFYAKKGKFLLLALLLLSIGLFSLPLAVADGADEILVFVFIPVYSVFCLAVGGFFLAQGLSKNPMLSLSEEGIYVRHMPSFKPLFSPWTDIWAVKMANDFIGTDVVVVLVKNPQGLVAGVQGLVPKNHARNAHKLFGSPLSIRTGQVHAKAVPLFKILYAEIEKRKNSMGMEN